MYISAATHWALVIPWRGLSLVGLDAFDLLSGNYQVGGCTLTPLLLLNIVLGDGIVLWRASWVLWQQHRFNKIIMQGVSASLIIATLITAALNAKYTCRYPAFHAEFADPTGIAALALSGLTNMTATGLIILKAWRHRRLMKPDFKLTSSRTKTEKALLMFVDCGIIYSVFWITLLIGLSVTKGAVLATSTVQFVSMERFAYGFTVFMDTGLIDLIGIYPTILVILSALSMDVSNHTGGSVKARRLVVNMRLGGDTCTEAPTSSSIVAATQDCGLLAMPLSGV
ncbi:hypothetical protein PHLGIDRAFT_466600 [Phlebiopsis gigantea 11061_1 CR5-6]|uniref:Uncharacterized protein n=1 Tax=Phlebiopsis gigantea (strain 11061_1 CR5-6) TaxID=745531 RepID=A0A0C3RX05_PHLG1|nr:hypothetical protein PHLGIDRAFT_466600 [Phlebiopsis gigantea 11061_1 CR5-6]